MNNNPAFTSDESLVPSLIQLAGQTEDPSVARPGLIGRRTLAEMTLNPRRLAAILDAVVKKKKSASR
jgi:hypothetical protein